LHPKRLKQDGRKAAPLKLTGDSHGRWACGSHDDVKLVVLAQELEGVDLAGELDPDPASLAGILAAAVEEMLDRHLDAGVPYGGAPRKGRLTDEQRRALVLLASSPRGLTEEALVLAMGSIATCSQPLSVPGSRSTTA
jgi:hypothetical protein